MQRHVPSRDLRHMPHGRQATWLGECSRMTPDTARVIARNISSMTLAQAGAASRRLPGGRPGLALEPFLELPLVRGHLLARLAAGERRDDRPEQAVSPEVELDRHL